MFRKKSRLTEHRTQESWNVEETLNKCQQIMCDHIEVIYFLEYVCTLRNCFPSTFYGKIKFFWKWLEKWVAQTTDTLSVVGNLYIGYYRAPSEV